MWCKTGLPNFLLTCLGDRTEMAHSVEARTPFLDHHLSEYVNRLPPSVKLHYSADAASAAGELGPTWTKSSKHMQSLSEKWILRQAVRPYITDELFNRKKHPFLAPTQWTKDGPLYRMFKGLLTQDAVEQLGFVDWEVIRQAMETAWGEAANPRSFRLLVFCGCWVTLSQRMGVAKADASDYEVTAQ
jgi:asparagine synthase (glutamine-hydrolysing)